LFFIGTALLTSAGGTGLINYMGSSFVIKARLAPVPGQYKEAVKEKEQDPTLAEETSALELHTQTLFNRTRITRIYDTAFLSDTGRGFATLELASGVSYTPASTQADPDSVVAGAGEETVAETLDESGKVIGRWIVKWTGEGRGECRAVGSVVRYFSISKEELPRLH